VTERHKRGPRLQPEELARIGQLIGDFCGIKLGEDTRDAVERRLVERLEALGLETFGQYASHLRSSEDGRAELERAAELVATNETYFFREQSQLRTFEHEVLPALERLGHNRRSLTIWSAGCSTGEEVYTIAILVARCPLFADFSVRVFGSDLSRRVLQTARKGVYRSASFRSMPSEYERYFVDTAEGRSIDPALRASCRFGHFNLLDASRAAMVGQVDAIFCRNVLIYFDDEARSKVIATFYERLQPGGFLMLGHSESLLRADTAFEPVQLAGELVYRKPLRAVAAPRS
jgi:chemotaxis protein methyltransferase CheR